jgi:nucleoside-diphosphate-sugar epimerase
VEGARSAFVTGGSGFVGGTLLRRLRADGWRVRALARSDPSAEALAEAGAEPVRGDLDQVDAMTEGADGCDVVFHAAANVDQWGPWEHFERVNVLGTRHVIEACRHAGVGRLVHVGTEAALSAGRPLVRVDETAPLRPDSKAPYCASKAMAEKEVLGANGAGLETVVLRPRFVWGPGDKTVLPELVKAVKSGRFAWMGGGEYLTSTTHVDNAVHGLVLAAERGHPGESYFVTDGDPVVFRDFVTQLLSTQGLEAPSRKLPLSLARAGAAACEAAWRVLPLRGAPPLNRATVWLSGMEVSIDISKARLEMGYEPVISIDRGLQGLRAAA